jgi:transcriptional regulator with XRE-family HTH domain
MLEGSVRNIVGKQVCRLRKRGGLTQDDLAARCSVLGFEIGRSTVSHIETGLRGVSDLEMVLLAKALRVPVPELIPIRLPRWKRDLRPPTTDKTE